MARPPLQRTQPDWSALRYWIPALAGAFLLMAVLPWPGWLEGLLPFVAAALVLARTRNRDRDDGALPDPTLGDVAVDMNVTGGDAIYILGQRHSRALWVVTMVAVACMFVAGVAAMVARPGVIPAVVTIFAGMTLDGMWADRMTRIELLPQGLKVGPRPKIALAKVEIAEAGVDDGLYVLLHDGRHVPLPPFDAVGRAERDDAVTAADQINAWLKTGAPRSL